MAASSLVLLAVASAGMASPPCVDHQDQSNFVGDLDTSVFGNGPRGQFLTDDSHLYMALSEFHVIDIQSPQQPLMVGQCSPSNSIISGIAKSGNHVFLARGNYSSGELVVIDVSTPSAPVEVSVQAMYTLSSFSTDMGISGDYLFVSGYGDVKIFDISTPSAPVLHDTVSLEVTQRVYGVVILPGYVYALTDVGLFVIDIDPINNPKLLSTKPIIAKDAIYDGSNVFAIGDDGWLTLQVNSLKNPTTIATDPSITGRWIRTLDGEIYTAHPFRRIDVSNPTSPIATAPLESNWFNLGAAANVGFSVTGGHAYLPRREGVRVLDVASLSAASHCGQERVFGDEHDVITVGNTAHVLVRLYDGMVSFASVHSVDITDPLAPTQFVNNYAGDQVGTPWNSPIPNRIGAIAVDPVGAGNTAFTVIYERLTAWDVSSPAWNDTLGSVWMHDESVPADLEVRGDHAFVTTDVGLKVVDVSTPTSPTVVTTELLYHLGALDVAGTRAYVVESGGDRMAILDITSPAAPVPLFNASIGFEASAITVEGGFAYLTDRGTGDLRVLDISVPASPTSVGTASQPYPASVPVDVEVHAEVAYVACEINGILAFDVRDPTAPSYLGGSFASGGVDRLTVSAAGNVLGVFGLVYPPSLRVYSPQCPIGTVSTPSIAAAPSGLTVAPNPFHLGTAIRFQASGPVDLRVFDVQGRLVRSLGPLRAADGARVVPWDGRDGAGQRVAPGVYFVRLHDVERAAVRKVVARPAR